jgi:hypothetical protein
MLQTGCRCVGLVMLGIVAQARAQTSYPMITRVVPSAVQRGQTVEIVIAGTHDFSGASQLLFEGAGLKAQVLESDGGPKPDAKGRMRSNGSVRATLTVAKDAALGLREIRAVTPQGVSSIGIVVIVPDSVVVEADDSANDGPSRAQPLELPVVVSGTIGKVEDVDWYSISARAGQRITFSLWGNRLENKIHDLQTHLDPIIQLHDAQGRELAVNDNHDFADPMLSYEFKETGTYLIQVRDTTYAGNANWVYVQAIALEVPADTQLGLQTFPLPTAQGTAPPVPLVVTDLPLAVETDDSPADSDQAQALSLPVALSGQLAEVNDLDGFRIEAKKGTLYAFEVVARRAGAATDPVLRVLDSN